MKKTKQWKTLAIGLVVLLSIVGIIICSGCIQEKADVTITTDKTEYEIGETIKASVNYSGKIYVWQETGYPWSIQKFENNSWDTIKKYDNFWCNTDDCKGVNLIEVKGCCIEIVCSLPANWGTWQEVKEAQEYVWNQEQYTITKEFTCKLYNDHIVNRTCNLFEQVPPGKYKIRFEYATQIDRNETYNRSAGIIQYAEKEFIIKEK